MTPEHSCCDHSVLSACNRDSCEYEYIPVFKLSFEEMRSGCWEYYLMKNSDCLTQRGKTEPSINSFGKILFTPQQPPVYITCSTHAHSTNTCSGTLGSSCVSSQFSSIKVAFPCLSLIPPWMARLEHVSLPLQVLHSLLLLPGSAAQNGWCSFRGQQAPVASRFPTPLLPFRCRSPSQHSALKDMDLEVSQTWDQPGNTLPFPLSSFWLALLPRM